MSTRMMDSDAPIGPSKRKVFSDSRLDLTGPLPDNAVLKVRWDQLWEHVMIDCHLDGRLEWRLHIGHGRWSQGGSVPHGLRDWIDVWVHLFGHNIRKGRSGSRG